jgi:two-component system, NarL family, response regulator LiaR
MPIRIMLVDDHGVVRQGLRMFLSLDPELEVIGEASSGDEAIELAKKLQPDVILLDLIMPGTDGIATIQQIRKDRIQTEIIALTSVIDDTLIYGALRAGALGYLLKDTQADDLCRAIKAASNGQVQLSPQIAARLVREVKVPESPEILTSRETAVLCLIAKGKSNKEISDDLQITEKTVKTHVSNILSKLNLPSRTQAALYAVRTGLVNVSGDSEPRTAAA